MACLHFIRDDELMEKGIFPADAEIEEEAGRLCPRCKTPAGRIVGFNTIWVDDEPAEGCIPYVECTHCGWRWWDL